MADSIILFVDRCLGKHPIVEILRETGVQVEVHDDHFAQNALDIDWLPVVGQKGWVILTKDERIGRNALERQAVARAGLRMFTLASKRLTGAETAAVFRQALGKILRFACEYPTPFIAKVYKNGKVSTWKTAEELLAEIEQ
jgi:predicted nuclease of predicted toxin-antitoxin system